MYNCGDILYNKETGNLILVIGYNADDINEILRAKKIDTIEKLDNTYVWKISLHPFPAKTTHTKHLPRSHA